MAIQLHDGRMITGKTSDLVGAAAGALINALKELGGIQQEMDLISPIIIQPIQDLKVQHLGNNNPRLHSDEILIALSICAATNPTAALAFRQIPKLIGCEAHSSHMLSSADENTLRRLGINITSEARFPNDDLFYM